MLRLAGALALAVGAVGLLGYLRVVGKGPFATPAERHLRAMKDRVAAPDSFAPIGFDGMIALPRRRPLDEYAAIERRGVVLGGYVQSMFRSPDGDFHVELVPRNPGPDGRLVGGVSAEVTPQWRHGSRAWEYERLVATFRPLEGGRGHFEDPPRRVRISGWLLYDFEYEGVTPRVGRARRTQWEIHPVTAIEVWDDSTGTFAELAR